VGNDLLGDAVSVAAEAVGFDGNDAADTRRNSSPSASKVNRAGGLDVERRLVLAEHETLPNLARGPTAGQGQARIAVCGYSNYGDGLAREDSSYLSPRQQFLEPGSHRRGR
jgi:hypothetical protein